MDGAPRLDQLLHLVTWPLADPLETVLWSWALVVAACGLHSSMSNS